MNTSLAAQAYFLARALDGPRPRTALLVRAAALADLVLRGTLSDANGYVEVRTVKPTGDLLLDDLLTELRPASWRAVLRHGKNDTLHTLETQLSAAGMLTESVSGILRRRVLEPAEEHVHDARARFTGALTDAVSEVDTSAAVVTVLATAAGFARPDARRHADRLTELEAAGGPAIAPLRRAVAGHRTTRLNA